jgi:hypothetical protein
VAGQVSKLNPPTGSIDTPTASPSRHPHGHRGGPQCPAASTVGHHRRTSLPSLVHSPLGTSMHRTHPRQPSPRPRTYRSPHRAQGSSLQRPHPRSCIARRRVRSGRSQTAAGQAPLLHPRSVGGHQGCLSGLTRPRWKMHPLDRHHARLVHHRRRQVLRRLQ